MRDWLIDRIIEFPEVERAYVFGSVMRGSSAPNDVDVVFVTAGCVGSQQWNKVRALRDELVGLFAQEFHVPLSLIIASTSEWEELCRGVIKDNHLFYYRDQVHI